jgi:hypothetical protein
MCIIYNRPAILQLAGACCFLLPRGAMSRKAPKRAQPSELTGPYATSPNYEWKPLAPPGNRHIPGRWGKSSSTAVRKGMRFGLLEPCKRDPNLQVFQQRLHTWPHPHNILEVFMHCDASQMLGSNYQWEMPWYWNTKNWRRNYNDHYDYDQSLLVSNTIVLLEIFLHDDPQFARWRMVSQ